MFRTINFHDNSNEIRAVPDRLVQSFRNQKRGKGKAMLVQIWTDPEGSRRWRLPDFLMIGT
jgi:hypothetical protein